MCNCGCNTCETKGPLLTEGKVKSLLSEGLQYHINKKIPLFETVYRIGSDKHLSLIKEARKMYSRNVIDLCEEDEALIKTHLGEFALYEGESVPLDLPMLEAEIDYEKEKTHKIQDKFPIEVTARKGWSGNYYTIKPKPMDISYDAFIDLGSGGNVGYSSYDYTTGEAQWTSDSLEQIKQWEEDNQDKIKVIYPNNIRESYDYDEVAQSEFGMDYDQLGSGEKEWVRDEIDNMSMNEAEFKGKDVPLNKPKRGGSKAYYVYVRDPKTKKIKKVSFGSGGLRAKIKNKKARNAFAARHKCKDKKDRTKAGYWSCNLPRYAKALGLGANMNTFW